MSPLFHALTLGLLSAVSLPLGTLTAQLWRAGDRSTAILMSFGAGALLAALTIDLVAPALGAHQFVSLAVGMAVGSLLFIGLNRVVNQRGGFLRKVSTTIFHFERRVARELRRSITKVNRVEGLNELPSAAVAQLADDATTHEYRRGATVYRSGDPCERLYVVAEGRVEVRDPRLESRVVATAEANDAFGTLAFFTRCPHAHHAVAVDNSRVWSLGAGAFDELLPRCPPLQKATLAVVESERAANYLKKWANKSEAEVAAWRLSVREALQKGRTAPEALPVRRREAEFQRQFTAFSHVPFFEGLSEETVRALSQHVFWVKHEPGYTFFHKGEIADRLYLLDDGTASLLDKRQRQPQVRGAGSAIGALSFVTRAPHSMSAVAVATTSAWVLPYDAFFEVQCSAPDLERAVLRLIEHQRTTEYLERRHKLAAGKAARWTREAVRNVRQGHLVPSVVEMTRELKSQRGAAVAIWLGILLDGIPESLAIGAESLAGEGTRWSLIAGLFLSNYPEALSSSQGMREQGISWLLVYLMWGSLCLGTGAGAALGSILLVGASTASHCLLNGVAAGAMLTMIAETMLPEAYYKGGPVVGFSTLLGFLAALFFGAI